MGRLSPLGQRRAGMRDAIASYSERGKIWATQRIHASCQGKSASRSRRSIARAMRSTAASISTMNGILNRLRSVIGERT
jgi:hypothetical protein